MNNEIFKSKWKQFTGHIKKMWGQLTDDDIAVINGSYEVLLGKIQERYGYAKEDAEKEVEDFGKKINSNLEVDKEE